MDRARGGRHSLGLAVALSLALAAIVLLATYAPSAPSRSLAAHPTLVVRGAIHPAFVPHSLQFPGTQDVFELTSLRDRALVDLSYLNGTNELVLYNARFGTATVVQQFVPGGAFVTPLSMIAAGGEFYIAWNNFSIGTTYFDKVGFGGAISSVNLPLGPSLQWMFAYGNASRMFAAAGGYLVELNATSGALVANFSSSLPSRVFVLSVYPSAGRLYLAGALSSTTGGGVSAWLGYLNLSSRAVTALTHPHSYPSNVSASFGELLGFNGSIYAGGVIGKSSINPFSIDSVEGLLYRFDPATAKLHNESRILPISGAGVFGLVPWESTIGLSLSRYHFTGANSNITGGIFTLSPNGNFLVNRSSLLPAGFVTFVAAETSGNSEWFFSGGYNSVASDGQVVGIRL